MTLRDLFDEFEPLNSTFYDYEEEAMNHAVYDEDIIYPALGLVSEAGEVADKIKKAMRDEGLEIPTRPRRRPTSSHCIDGTWRRTLVRHCPRWRSGLRPRRHRHHEHRQTP